MSGLCEGRVVIVTGAGRGIGRAHAQAFAAEGASVIVNDISSEFAHEVAGEIGGVANTDDVADWTAAEHLIATAVTTFGRLDVLVNNAGFVRDRMLVSLTEPEWDDVIRVHLKGHAAPLHHAASYWRDQHKSGATVAASVINTSSGAGLLGSVGQANYSAAKAGIAALTLVAAAELARYGITVNAIAPAARTRMTERTFAATMAKPDHGFDAMAPDNVSPLVVWLGSNESRHVTGRMFEVEGGKIAIANGWHHGPTRDKTARWTPTELGPVIAELLAEAVDPDPVYSSSV